MKDMMKLKTLAILIMVVAFLASCKKEPTTWDADWSAPIAHGHLTINDMIPVNYLETNSDGYLSLVIHESIFEFSLDTLIKLPDTTIVEKTAIGIPSIEVTPLFSLTDDYDQGYELGDIHLKRVIIESGQAFTTIKSPWPGKTKITFTFPEVTSPSGVFERVYYLDAGSISSPAMVSDIINMAEYDMDLRGVDAIDYNTIGIKVLIQSNEATDNYIVTNADSIAFSFEFKDMIPHYAKGYFGQYTFSDTMGVSLAPMKKIIGGSVDLDSINLKLTVKNGFNLVAQAQISKMTGINTRTSNLIDLDFAEKGSILNINPASGGLYDYVPSEYPLILNNSNTNMLAFLENLSDSILVGYQLKINPFGNITGGSDEYFPNSKMELFLDGEFPLNFGANDLTIADTLDIDWIETGSLTPQEALVYLDYANGFPIGATAKFYLLDETNTVIDSIVGSSPILPGNYFSDSYLTNPQTGAVQFALTERHFTHLEQTKRMILHVSFKTYDSDKIKIMPETAFDFKLRSNLQIRISI